jgi:hypothetical protein
VLDRLIGTAVVLIVVALALPTVATFALAAVPSLMSLVVFLAIVRLAWPVPRRRRRR